MTLQNFRSKNAVVIFTYVPSISKPVVSRGAGSGFSEADHVARSLGAAARPAVMSGCVKLTPGWTLKDQPTQVVETIWCLPYGALAVFVDDEGMVEPADDEVHAVKEWRFEK